MYKKRKGSLLVNVLLVFVLIVAFSVIIYTNSTTNLKEAKYDEQRKEAYYLAKSGLEMGLSSFFTKVNPANDAEKTFFDNLVTTSLSGGVVNVTIKNKSGVQRITPENSNGFLKPKQYIWLGYRPATQDENLMVDPSGTKKYIKIMARGITEADRNYNLDEYIRNGIFFDYLVVVNAADPQDRLFINPNPDITIDDAGVKVHQNWPKPWDIGWDKSWDDEWD